MKQSHLWNNLHNMVHMTQSPNARFSQHSPFDTNFILWSSKHGPLWHASKNIVILMTGSQKRAHLWPGPHNVVSVMCHPWPGQWPSSGDMSRITWISSHSVHQMGSLNIHHIVSTKWSLRYCPKKQDRRNTRQLNFHKLFFAVLIIHI